jgi:hypothetical protein
VKLVEPDAHRAWRSAPATLAWLVPVGAVSGFVVLYAVAAWLYPGGSSAHPAQTGFSFFENYWCDLLDATAYGGRPNPARPVALTATVVLSAGLSVLWWAVPALFPGASRRAALVRVAGVASAAITPFIATRHHDVAIQLAGLPGITGFAVTMATLGHRAGRATTATARLALLLIVVNYFIWETRIGHAALALVQKGAFAAFLAWVVLIALRLRAER